eukprot:5732051-Amphidinium_carterae.2
MLQLRLQQYKLIDECASHCLEESAFRSRWDKSETPIVLPLLDTIDWRCRRWSSTHHSRHCRADDCGDHGRPLQTWGAAANSTSMRT